MKTKSSKLNNTQLDFSGQVFFVGIDVHKKSWHVTIRSNGMRLNSFSMNPSAKELKSHMKRNYPGGIYKSVYEAGFCGFSVHRDLIKEGIENIVINPADVPTSGKEKMGKTDSVDSHKLSRELEHGTLRAIYIPTMELEALRGLVRLRYQVTGNQTRVKNRIKGHLNLCGIKTPENIEVKHWSANFIKHLETLEFENPMLREKLMIYLSELRQARERLLSVMKLIKTSIKATGKQKELDLLLSVPGIGMITAVTLLTEIMEIERFKSFDELASFSGFVPSVHNSGEREKTLGMTYRYNRFIKSMLVESAWVAVRQDPVLTGSFGSLSRRMKKSKAIVRIAKKLLSRIRFVLKEKTPYLKGTTQNSGNQDKASQGRSNQSAKDNKQNKSITLNTDSILAEYFDTDNISNDNISNENISNERTKNKRVYKLKGSY